MAYFGVVLDLRRPTSTTLLVRYKAPTDFATGEIIVRDSWTMAEVSRAAVSPGTVTLSGLRASRRYLVSVEATLLSAATGETDAAIIDTLLSPTDGFACEWWWMGERTSRMRRLTGVDKQRVALNVSTAGRYCRFGVSCEEQNRRVHISSIQMRMRDRDHGLEARTPE